MSDAQRLPHLEGLVSSDANHKLYAPQASFNSVEALGLLRR